jgi:hypothetical protein
MPGGYDFADVCVFLLQIAFGVGIIFTVVLFSVKCIGWARQK